MMSNMDSAVESLLAFCKRLLKLFSNTFKFVKVNTKSVNKNPHNLYIKAGFKNC